MRVSNPARLGRLFKALVTARRLIHSAPRWSVDEMRAEQFSRIQRLVRHAYANVPFYHDLYAGASFEPGDLRTRDDFERLPVISKDDVIAAYPDRILRKGVPKESLRVTRSSGSSGKVLDIAFDQNAMNWPHSSDALCWTSIRPRN